MDSTFAKICQEIPQSSPEILIGMLASAPWTGCAELVITLGVYLEPVWDGDSLDWKEISAQEIAQRVTSRVQSGSIVLFHNAALHTPEALPGILEYLLGQGYSIVPVSQLVLSGEEGTDYTIDHTGRQCPLP